MIQLFNLGIQSITSPRHATNALTTNNNILSFFPHEVLNNKDGLAVMEEFLNADLPCLLVNGDTGAPTMELPERLPKNKWFYMLKVNPDDPIPEKGFEKSVTCGDMAQDPLEHMERTLREVILPQLQNEVNQG
jgi:hypothetical protein